MTSPLRRASVKILRPTVSPLIQRGTRTIQLDPDLQSSLSVCFPHRSEVARPALIATYMAAVQYSGSDWLAEVTPSSSVRDAVTFDSTAPPPSHPPTLPQLPKIRSELLPAKMADTKGQKVTGAVQHFRLKQSHFLDQVMLQVATLR